LLLYGTGKNKIIFKKKNNNKITCQCIYLDMDQKKNKAATTFLSQQCKEKINTYMHKIKKRSAAFSKVI